MSDQAPGDESEPGSRPFRLSEHPWFTLEPAGSHGRIASLDAVMALCWTVLAVAVTVIAPGVVGILLASTACAFAVRGIGRARAGYDSWWVSTIVFGVTFASLCVAIYRAVHSLQLSIGA